MYEKSVTGFPGSSNLLVFYASFPGSEVYFLLNTWYGNSYLEGKCMFSVGQKSIFVGVSPAIHN